MNSGKTNILDGIHYLSLTKSYFNSSDIDSVNFNSEFFTVKGSFENDRIISEIVCHHKKGIQSQLKIMTKNIKSFQIMLVTIL